MTHTEEVESKRHILAQILRRPLAIGVVAVTAGAAAALGLQPAVDSETTARRNGPAPVAATRPVEPAPPPGDRHDAPPAPTSRVDEPAVSPPAERATTVVAAQQHVAAARTTLDATPRPASAVDTQDATDDSGDGARRAAPRDETIFLTIVGDQTFVSRGPATARPRAAALQAAGPGDIQTAATPAPPPVTRDLPVVDTRQRTAPAPSPERSRYTDNAGGTQPATNPVQPDYSAATTLPDTREVVDNRPWPTASCPWTLDPASDADTAQFMYDQYGCRYLSTCRVEDGSCTYYYMGS